MGESGGNLRDRDENRVMYIPRMSDDDLRKFIDDFCSGRIFTSAQLRPHDPIKTVFMPLVFGAFDIPEERKPPKPVEPEEPPAPDPPEPIDPEILYQIRWGDIDGTPILADYRKRKDKYAEQCEAHDQEMERYILACEDYQRDLGEWDDQVRELMEEWTQDVGVIWEHLNKAGPVSINGYPTFFSFHIMHRKDWERAINAIEKETERRKQIEI